MAPVKAVLAVCAALLGLHTLFSLFSNSDYKALADPALTDRDQIPLAPDLHHDNDNNNYSSPPPPPHPTEVHKDSSNDDDDPFAHIDIDVGNVSTLPHTQLLFHSPGWTLFRDAYLANGTLYIVTADRAAWPDRKFMTSTGLPGFNTPENIAARMPTDTEMAFITPDEANRRWGHPSNTRHGGRNKVWTLTGNTIIFNDPIQFLDHYYHFVAELWFGTWAAWRGVFPSTSFSNPRSLPHRAFLPHVEGETWHDKHGFNGYFLRAFLPSFTMETARGWADRALATRDGGRAYHLPHVLLVDRSACFRANICGDVHRTAASAYYPLARAGALASDWWEPARRAILTFAGLPRTVLSRARLDRGSVPLVKGDLRLIEGLEAGNKHQVSRGSWHALDWEAAREREQAVRDKADRAAAREGAPTPPFVVTYINRQKSRRRLREPDATALESALTKLCARRGWELNVAYAEKLTIDEQLALAARTTVMLGVHGNGLSHLIWMPPRPESTVIELFFPEGFAHDYEWTARALGHKHFGVWNNQSFTWPETPWVAYPDGFQGTEIPVQAQIVVDLIERRLDGKL